MTCFHTSEIQLLRAVNRGQKQLNRQIRALSENFKASSSEAWTTWTVRSSGDRARRVGIDALNDGSENIYALNVELKALTKPTS